MKPIHASWLTWSIVALFGLALVGILIPHGDARNDWYFRAFGSLPIQEGGRVKPIDTQARTMMRVLNHREQYRDEKGKAHSATKWLLDVATAGSHGPTDGDKNLDREVFRIQDHKTLEMLGLPTRSSQRYSVNEFLGAIRPFLKEVNAAKKKDPKERSPEERRQLEFLDERGHELIEQFQNTLILFSLNHPILRIDNEEVLDTLNLKARPGFRYALVEFIEQLEGFFREALRAKELEEKKRNPRDLKLVQLYDHLGIMLQLARGKTLTAIPPATGGDEWQTVNQALGQSRFRKGGSPYAEQFQNILDAYAQGDKESFNRGVREYAQELDKQFPDIMNKVYLEVYFNEVAPFYYGAFLYMAVALLSCLSWLTWLKPSLGLFRPLNRALFWASIAIVAVHFWGLLVRMYLQDRPLVMVTNLYSSAIFIGFGCVITCIVVECLFRNGLALTVGSICGALSLLIAHLLGLSGDTLEMLQAVLDTDFWLATHVTCITFGYTACFVAGFTAIGFVLAGLFTRALAHGGAAILAKMMYGIICFAMFLSFTGTVLGGIWADQSWGRFWGWDPKENGALLIVLWNALILHARWGGMIKPRGMAVLAILGNIVTAWSWFGVNLLGVGLHNYGFMHGAFIGLIAFVASQLVLVGLGLIPLRYWRSFAPPDKRPSVPGSSQNAPVQRKQPVLAGR